MDSFLRVGTGHNGEVDGPTEVDQVGIGLVLDLHSLLLLILFIFRRTLVFVLVVILVVAALAQNFSPKLLVRFFVLLPLRIKFENIEPILRINLAF